VRAALIAVLVAMALPANAAAAEWLAGDLHVHTTYSHDSYGGPADDNTGPDEAYTLGWSVGDQFRIAKTRGLDYLAITDHNDIRSQSDPGFGAGGLIPIPAYENSLKGHAQMLGARRIYDSGDESAAAVQTMADALRADGGAFQANHPFDPRWEYGYDVRPDTVEVWNLPRYYQPPLPSATDNDWAIHYWEGWLDSGERVGATGGSDNHWRSTTAAQGAGQPTTWVRAEDRSPEAVLDGIRAGHTFISYQPPAYGGPRVFLEADGDGDRRYESIVGDRVPPGSRLRVRVRGASGAYLSVISDGGKQAFPAVPITSTRFERRFRLPASAHWVRAEVYGNDLLGQRSARCEPMLGAQTAYCRNRILALAMTSAVYLGTG
jgi:hypothetical protein